MFRSKYEIVTRPSFLIHFLCAGSHSEYADFVLASGCKRYLPSTTARLSCFLPRGLILTLMDPVFHSSIITVWLNIQYVFNISPSRRRIFQLHCTGFLQPVGTEMQPCESAAPAKHSPSIIQVHRSNRKVKAKTVPGAQTANNPVMVRAQLEGCIRVGVTEPFIFRSLTRSIK